MLLTLLQVMKQMECFKALWLQKHAENPYTSTSLFSKAKENFARNMQYVYDINNNDDLTYWVGIY